MGDNYRYEKQQERVLVFKASNHLYPILSFRERGTLIFDLQIQSPIEYDYWVASAQIWAQYSVEIPLLNDIALAPFRFGRFRPVWLGRKKDQYVVRISAAAAGWSHPWPALKSLGPGRVLVDAAEALLKANANSDLYRLWIEDQGQFKISMQYRFTAPARLTLLAHGNPTPTNLEFFLNYWVKKYSKQYELRVEFTDPQLARTILAAQFQIRLAARDKGKPIYLGIFYPQKGIKVLTYRLRFFERWNQSVETAIKLDLPANPPADLVLVANQKLDKRTEYGGFLIGHKPGTLRLGKVFKGSKQSFDVTFPEWPTVPSFFWHTHPFGAYTHHQFVIAIPSVPDFTISLQYPDIVIQQFIFTIEGCYTFRLNWVARAILLFLKQYEPVNARELFDVIQEYVSVESQRIIDEILKKCKPCMDYDFPEIWEEIINQQTVFITGQRYANFTDTVRQEIQRFVDHYNAPLSVILRQSRAPPQVLQRVITLVERFTLEDFPIFHLSFTEK